MMCTIIAAGLGVVATPRLLSYGQTRRIDSNSAVGVYLGHGGERGSVVVKHQ